MLIDDVTTEGICGPDRGVVWSLRRGKTVVGKAKRQIGVWIDQGVLLLVAEPEVGVVIVDSGAPV